MTETPTDRQTELQHLRAQHARLEAERAEREAAADEEDEIIAARRAVREAEALNKAIGEHGRVDHGIATIETTIGLVIVKRASALRFRRFQDQGEYKYENLLKLVTPCVVYPDADRFSQMLDEQPAILTLAGNAVARLAGIRKEDVEKK